ncbi:MAG: hypothetical protein ACI9NC_002705 [Verrucomicrobiales bacterium]|jgi:hypothetical protein
MIRFEKELNECPKAVVGIFIDNLSYIRLSQLREGLAAQCFVV